MSIEVHTTKKQRDKVLKEEGRVILCARMYNDYKCWNNTRCCEYLMNNEKCSAFVRIPDEEKLKPCPFCGEKGVFVKFYRDGWTVGCGNKFCPVHPTTHIDTKKEATAAWNERHSSWGLLMEILDEHYPADIFSDPNSRWGKDIGSQIVTKVREINELRNNSKRIGGEYEK